MPPAKTVDLPNLGPVTITRQPDGSFTASGTRVQDWRTPWEVTFVVRGTQIGISEWTYNLGDESSAEYRTVRAALRAALKPAAKQNPAPPADVVEAYSAGRCLWLALVLHDRFRWPIFGQMHQGRDPYIAHAYVRMPDGTEVDILGPQEQVDDFEPRSAHVQLDPAQLRALARPGDMSQAKKVAERYVIPRLYRPNPLVGWVKQTQESARNVPAAYRPIVLPRSGETYELKLAKVPFDIVVVVGSRLHREDRRSFTFDVEVEQLRLQRKDACVLIVPMDGPGLGAMDRSRSDRLHASPYTPFVLLHRLGDWLQMHADISYTIPAELPNLYQSLWFRAHSAPLDYVSFVENAAFEVFNAGVDTEAGRRNMLVDGENMVSDLFAKWCLTGRVAFDWKAPMPMVDAVLAHADEWWPPPRHAKSGAELASVPDILEFDIAEAQQGRRFLNSDLTGGKGGVGLFEQMARTAPGNVFYI